MYHPNLYIIQSSHSLPCSSAASHPNSYLSLLITSPPVTTTTRSVHKAYVGPLHGVVLTRRSVLIMQLPRNSSRRPKRPSSPLLVSPSMIYKHVLLQRLTLRSPKLMLLNVLQRRVMIRRRLRRLLSMKPPSVSLALNSLHPVSTRHKLVSK